MAKQKQELLTKDFLESLEYQKLDYGSYYSIVTPDGRLTIDKWGVLQEGIFKNMLLDENLKKELMNDYNSIRA